MEIDRFNGLLLLDLDCVTIYGGSPRDALSAEIYLLHSELPAALDQLGWRVILLTHRSQRDANLIRSYLEEYGCQFEDCISARQLFSAAVLELSFLKLLTTGLSKSFALGFLEKKYSVKRDQMILVDDRPENIEELIRGGMKCGVLAPFELFDQTQEESKVNTFDFQQIVNWIKANFPDSEHGLFEATPVGRKLSELPIVGHIETRSFGPFELFRRTLKWLRNKIKVSCM